MTRRRTVPRGLKPLLIVLFATLLLALPATAAAGGWASFSSIPTSGTVTAPKLAADQAGNEVAIWVQQPSPFKVMASYRAVGGSWSPARQLDGSATTLPITDLAVDGSGNVIVLYSEVIGATSKVFSNYLPAGSTNFGSQQQFGNTLVGAVVLTGIAVAMDQSKGTAYAVAGIAGSPGFGAVRSTGAGSTWVAASAGLPTGSGNAVDLTVTNQGTPTLVDYPGAGGALRHTRFDGTNWTTITTPAGPGNATGAVIIKPDANGATTTLFQVASTSTQVHTQSCPAGTAVGTTCTARTQLFLGSKIAALNPALAVDPSGNASASWTENASVLVAQRAGPAAAWTSPVQVGTGGSPAVNYDMTGALMSAFSEGQAMIKYLHANSGSVPVTPALNATDPVQSWNAPTLAADGDGNTYGAWLGTNADGIQTAVYDVEAPATPSLVAPASTVAGQPISFDTSSSDKWSGVAYSWDFGDGTTAPGANVSHAYTAAGTYTARAIATDGAGNTATQSQTVSVSAAPRPPLARPLAGKTVNLDPIGGVVLVKVPGTTDFVPLVEPTQVRDGSIIDARKGRVRITIDNGRGGLDTADFYGGVFKFTQPQMKIGQTWFANLYLFGGSFKGCPRAPRNPKVASASKKKAVKQGKSVRHLWGSGEGAFRTVGRYSSATVRGTTWLTDDRCNGTLTKVTTGRVGVRDFVLKKTVLVKKGKTYFAAPKPAKKAARTRR